MLVRTYTSMGSLSNENKDKTHMIEFGEVETSCVEYRGKQYYGQTNYK